MRYYGGFTIDQLFAKNDPARKIFEMAFGMEFDRVGYDTPFKQDQITYHLDYHHSFQWEQYKAKIPYTEFKEVNHNDRL